jgi:chromosome segregation ATPase
MEKRMGDCEMNLKETHKEIRRLEIKVQDIAVDKQTLCGKIDLLKTQIKNVDDKMEELKTLFLDYKKEQKEDIGEIRKDIKAINDCMSIFKIDTAKNSLIISIVIPIIILAVSFAFGFK